MQTSIKTILDLINKRGLCDVVAATLSDKYSDPDYTLTQADIDAVANSVDAKYEAVPAIGSVDLFGETQTPDTWLAARNAISTTMDDLIALALALGFRKPEAWRD
ncbi:hypothetical protein [Undibacterium sp. TJN19]|uniref:hypothetical protein n=1 Tax=Undibacterium sp. TJN19 TaxID=3413055 RepID=UPI003BF16143